MIHNYIEKILRTRVYDIAVETPLDPAPVLSARYGNRILLKREDLQPVFSFKLRGAYNKMMQLSDAEKSCGVIAASAGNHAQGVAMSARQLNVSALIVMPKTTPAIKVRSVQAKGAETILIGDSYDEAYAHAIQLAKQKQLSFIHPFDDPDVIAGQGTIGMEILRQHTQAIDAIFVPVGGGGLISGIAAYIKFVRPEIKIIAVEPDDADCLNQALKAQKRVVLQEVGLFADGVAVKQIGQAPFELARRYVDAVICVNTDEICAAIKDVFDDTRSVPEPAGALAVAGLKKYVETENISDQNLIAIDSGANINFDRLRYVAEQAEVGEHREILLAVTIPERPGTFIQFCDLLDERNITEFNYRYSSAEAAHIFVGVTCSGLAEDRRALIEKLERNQFQVTDMTENALAKEHIRYMVGGHAPNLQDEVIFKLQFPERPGALLNFLNQLGSRWNISLFHYRNHGAAFGKVLLGIQIPKQERSVFKQCLESSGFSYREESDNPAYQLFAGSGQ